MSALEALVLAGKGLNTFSVLFLSPVARTSGKLIDDEVAQFLCIYIYVWQ
jgi:hypothetical protein